MTHETHRSSSGKKVQTLLFVTIPFLATIWAMVYLGIDRYSLAMFFLFLVLSGYGVTMGYHRLFTHGSFKTSRLIMYALAICGGMSGEAPLFWWVTKHRVHHKYSDEPGDVHSPNLHGAGFWNGVKGFLHAHFWWLSKVDNSVYLVEDLRRVRGLVIINRLFPIWVALGLGAPAVIAGLVTMSWWGAFLGFIWGGVVRMFCVYHITWSINSICHLFGSQPYADTGDESRNNVVFGVLAFGEGWHNNHHHAPNSARHGFSMWQVDTTYYIIWLMGALGLAWDIKVPYSHPEDGSGLMKKFPKKEK
jgi:stearoyl-CoA desaturase (delta-9 desaturase)